MLEEKILNDYKEAMKSRDSVKSTLLSSLRAQFINAAMQKKVNKLEDADCLTVIKKLVKQHQDSIEQFTKGNRPDLAEKEELELKMLKLYLPEEPSAEMIKAAAKEAVSKTGAASMKDMGKVMKEMAALVPGADPKTVSDTVKELLSGKF